MKVDTIEMNMAEAIEQRLRSTDYRDQTYSELVNQAIWFKEKFRDEAAFHRWVEDNYHLFGFDRIIESNHMRFPDLIVEKNGEILRVEIETCSKNFLAHGHDPLKCDLVICLVDNAELPIKVVEIEAFSSDDRRKMSTVCVYLDSLLELNKLKRIRESRSKHEAHMESLADVMERAVDLLERERGVGE